MVQGQFLLGSLGSGLAGGRVGTCTKC